MILRAGTGWQYLLADLSLILFIVTAAALSQVDDGAGAGTAGAVSPQGEPLAFYRAGPDAPPLGQWLHDQSADTRQQLTIVAQYAPGRQHEAMDHAERLAREAGEAGTSARIVIEPGQGGTSATLAYDVPAAFVAR